MPFDENTKLAVKRQANFTCCWCRDQRNKVDVHHVVPEAEGDTSEEANAAPLCGSCHDLYGANPTLRKEIVLRRDQWYQTCARFLNPQYGWPIGLDVPLLPQHRQVGGTESLPVPGLQLSDRDPSDLNNPPLLYISFHFKRSRYFGRGIPDEGEKWLFVEANMRFALNLRIQVRTATDRDVQAVMAFLTRGDLRYVPEFMRDASSPLRAQYVEDLTKGWALYGPTPQPESHSGDYLRFWREQGEVRLMISTFTQTYAGISIHARMSADTARALAEYLELVGFAQSE